MNSRYFGSLVFIFVAFLYGCATADSYKNVSTSKLCLDYLTYPSVNINHGAREKELARRGEKCGDHLEVARARREADNAFRKSLDSMQESLKPRQQNTPTQTTCYQNGKFINCTTY